MKYCGKKKKKKQHLQDNKRVSGHLHVPLTIYTEPAQEAFLFHDKEYVPWCSPALLTIFAKSWLINTTATTLRMAQ